MTIVSLRHSVSRYILQRATASSSTLSASRQVSNAALSLSDGWMQGRSANPVSSPALAASFHTSVPRCEGEFTARDGLMDVLSREHAEENENETADMPSELKELQTQLLGEDWKIVDSADTGMIRMIRTTTGNNLKVQLSFHCQDDVEAETEQEFEGEENENENEHDDDEASTPNMFTVLVSKAGQTMVIQCLSEEGSAQIQSVAVTTTESPETIVSNGFISAQTYQGPEFTELAQDLQDAFQTWLEEELGINEDVASFIAMYADYKEQTQYVNFLDQCKKMMT